MSPEPDDRARAVRELVEAVDSLTQLARAANADMPVDEYLEFRARVGVLQARFDEANNRLAAELGLGSARVRLLKFLMLNEGRVVSKDELAGVAGIVEFARRIRELRAEGWGVSSMEDSPELRPGQYVLKRRRVQAEKRSASGPQDGGSE